MDINQFLKGVFSEDSGLSNYDITEGSNLYELFIVILDRLLNTKITQDIIDTEANRLDISNYQNLTIDQIKRLASNHLVRERYVNKTCGNINLHFSDPVDWTLSAGDKLYAGTIEFEILEDRTLRADPSDYVIEDGYYVYKNVLVINHTGDPVDADTLGQIDNAPATLIKVTHLDMTSGSKDYTAKEYYDLITKSLANRQLLSGDGTEFLVRQNFSGLKSLSVVGVGHESMERDLLYNTLISDGKYVHTSDFVGKLKSKIEAVASKGYFLYRIAADLTNEIDPLDAIELKQPDYNTISFEDGNYIELSTADVIKETFTQSSEVIGEIENILSDLIATDVYINVATIAGFEAGNIINIIDPASMYKAGSIVLVDLASTLNAGVTGSVLVTSAHSDLDTGLETYVICDGEVIKLVYIDATHVNILARGCMGTTDATHTSDKDMYGLIEPTPTRTAIIRQILNKQLTVTAITQGTPDEVEISGDEHDDYLKVGTKFYIRGGSDDGELCEVASLAEAGGKTTIEVVTSGTLHTDAAPSGVYIEFDVIEVYNQIGDAFDASGSCYIENVIGEGFNIGNSWVKSEHGMAIGQYLHPREAMVIAGELVLGTVNTDFAGNLLMDMIIRTGISKFIEAVKGSIRVVIGASVTPPVVVVEDDDELTELT